MSVEELTLIERLYATAFTERQRRLIANCEQYRSRFPGGLPGHNLMILVSKMDELIGLLAADVPSDKLEQIIVETDEWC